MERGKAAPVLFLALVLLVTGFTLWALWQPRVVYRTPAPPAGIPSAAVTVDVYVDGSKSMRNFLRAGGGGNSFRDFLRSCEFALKSGASRAGWNLGERHVHFWKFGPKHGPVQLDREGAAGGGALRSMADHPEQFDADSTSIEDVTNAYAATGERDEKHVMVLITDLYESNGELERPALAFERRFLKSGDGAVAVYGIRNPFSGKVSDIPGQTVELKDAATSMPFYILIGGDRAEDVREAQELLSGGDSGAPLQRALAEGRLFAAYFGRRSGRYSHDNIVYDARLQVGSGDHLLHFSAEPNPQPSPGEQGSARVDSKSRGRYSALVQNFQMDGQTRVATFDLVKRSAKDNKVAVSWVPVRNDPSAPIFETEGASMAPVAQWRIEALDCPAKRSTASTTVAAAAVATAAGCTQLMSDNRAAKGITICASTGSAERGCRPGSDPASQGRQIPVAQGRPMPTMQNETSPALSILIDRTYFSRGRPYLLELDQVADTANHTGSFVAGSTLMKHWNFAPDEVDSLLHSSGTPKTFPPDRGAGIDAHPGKTPNLDQFLSALDGYVMDAGSGSGNSAPLLNTYFLYLNAR